jgi:hypothetical protein
MNNTKQESKPTPTQPKPLTEEKRGRTITPPPRPSTNPKK